MYRTDRTNNAVFSLCYHFISVVKYRQKVFTSDELVSDLKTIICTIASDFDVEIIEQACGDDHLHILFRCKPTLDITKFINILKGRSSRMIRDTHKEFPAGSTAQVRLYDKTNASTVWESDVIAGPQTGYELSQPVTPAAGASLLEFWLSTPTDDGGDASCLTAGILAAR